VNTLERTFLLLCSDIFVALNLNPEWGCRLITVGLRSYLRMNDAPTTIYYLEEVAGKNKK
jgi:hypothetical protein